MTRRVRVLAALPTLALTALLLAGCGRQHQAAQSPGSTSPAPSASQLAHLRKLVDNADSAVAVAESDAAGDR